MKLFSGKVAVVLSCVCWSFVVGCDSVDMSFLFVTPVSTEATKTQSVTLSDGAKLVVNNNNGTTHINVDSDATKATIKITRIAFAQDETTADTLLDNIEMTVTEPTSSNKTLTIDAPCPSGATDDMNNFTVDLSDDEMEVTDILMAQQIAVVKLVITLPPDVEVEVTQKNGIIVATGLDAESSLTVTNGTVKVQESSGDVTVRVTDGKADVSDHEGSLDAAVEDGVIDVGVLGLSSTELILAEVTNGQITLNVPEDIDADLTAETTEGTVVFTKGDFDSVSDVTQTSQSVTATLNSGGPTISLQTENGSIHIEAQ